MNINEQLAERALMEYREIQKEIKKLTAEREEIRKAYEEGKVGFDKWLEKNEEIHRKKEERDMLARLIVIYTYGEEEDE